MKLFKNADEKLEELGFIKIKENKYGVMYERFNETHQYTQCLDITFKINGELLVQSYQEGVNKEGFNNMVGLKEKEIKLIIKKINEIKKKKRG